MSTKIRLIPLLVVAGAVLSVLPGCAVTGPGVRLDLADERLTTDKVFFAQQHVLAPDDHLFKLVSELDALIKVQVYSEGGAEAPEVWAELVLGPKKLDLPLRGPKELPKPPTGNPLLMRQSYDDSFTAFIPADWVKPGLEVYVELRTRKKQILDRHEINDLRIGAPNRFTLTMYDIHYFGRDPEGDYPDGWFDEFESKLPTADIDLRRVRRIFFNTLVAVPHGGKPAVRCSSPEEFKEKTGLPYDGEQAIALKWNAALRAANGAMNNGVGWTYVNIYGVPAGGQAGSFAGVGSGRRHGVLLHEFGHTFRLPDGWRPRTGFPYHGDMLGIKTSWSNSPHVGPAWAFDLKKRVFLPPTVQTNTVRGEVGLWKRDPMAGGGQGDQERTHLFRFFSDYSVGRIRDFVEKRATYWDQERGAYVQWDAEDGRYSKVVDTTGKVFPIERDVQVFSVLAAVSGVTPEANYVYAPIGPYKANLIQLFDPTVEEDRRKALEHGFTRERCNTCFKVTQEGRTRHYLLPVHISSDEDPVSRRSLHHGAVNLPVRDGKITRVELLHTPDVLEKGITQESRVLHTWESDEG